MFAGKIESKQDDIEEDKHYDAVIAGAGIAGLTAAAIATQQGKSVLVVERLEEEQASLRPQLISLDPNSQALFSSFKTKPLPSSYAYHAIQDIQDYLKKSIRTDLCQFLYGSMISSIDLEDGHLLVSHVKDSTQQKIIVFKDLILADGIRHRTANLLKDHIQYEPMPGRSEKHNVMACFTIKPKPEKNASLQACIPGYNMQAIFDGTHAGLIYIQDRSNRAKWKVCTVMNVPEAAVENLKSNRTLGIEYLTHCVASIFDPKKFDIHMKKSKTHGDEKDKLKYAVFSINLFKASRPCFEKNGHNVILTGDTAGYPDFYTGTGGNFAIHTGYGAGLVVAKHVTLTKYCDSVTAKLKRINEITQASQPFQCYVIDRKTPFSCVKDFPKKDEMIKPLSLSSNRLFKSPETKTTSSPRLEDYAPQGHGKTLSFYKMEQPKR